MSDRIFEDTFNLLCGRKLNAGIHRTVYECRLRADLVVKVETDEDLRSFANVRESLFWGDHEDHSAVARWLAPCEYLSPDGRVLLQRRCEPLRADDLPDRLPSFLTDIKAENFGWLDGRVVCVDYATTLTTVSTRLVKADWY